MATVKLMSAMAYDARTFEEQGIADPVIRVLGELPGYSQPFNLNRVYKAAQGQYEEIIVLLDPDDVVIWERESRFIRLRGEMFEDLFRMTVKDDIPISSPDEHTMVFLLDGAEAGRIPVFIDAPQSARSAGVLPEAAETALKKGSIMWLSIPQPDGATISRPAWYVQDGQTLFVIKGPQEQELPHLEDNDTVSVTVKSKEVKAAIGTMEADVRVVPNDSEEFERIATRGMGTRLNLPDGEGALERWRETCTMVELTPRA